MDLDEAVDGRRRLFKSCPRYFKGPGNGAFLISALRTGSETFAQLLPGPAGNAMAAAAVMVRRGTLRCSPLSDDLRQPLEGQIGNGWFYRAASIPGHVDFFQLDESEPASSSGLMDDHVQSVQVAGSPILEIRPLHDEDDREVLVISERTETIVRRSDDDEWIVDGHRPRS